jgi:hypothetical protein
MPRRFKHALPLSVARHGSWETNEVCVAMTALTVTDSSETRPLPKDVVPQWEGDPHQGCGLSGLSRHQCTRGAWL